MHITCRLQDKTVYIPVETVRVEYKDTYSRDSVYMHDSVLIRTKGDTVFFEKYKYLYRDKILRNSIIKTDSVQVPYPVTEYKEVNRISGWQNFQIWCGRILLVLLLGYVSLMCAKKYL